MILIDPPRWPAHGTEFSHLISDHSLAELHAFAAANGIDTRAFDRDHYDVPARRYQQLVEAGAHEVSGTALVRSLMASGLRVPARYRPEKLDRVLLDRWQREVGLELALGRALLTRWSEPHRRYHDRVHLLAVLEGLDLLLPEGISHSERRAAYLAAWFHDAVYNGSPSDEQESAELAESLLAGILPVEERQRVSALVLLTATHRARPSDSVAMSLCDADLEVLARPQPAYDRYVTAIAEEYAHVDPVLFAQGRLGILDDFLQRPAIYATPEAQRRWESAARANIEREVRRLNSELSSTAER
ncbi:hypothetical protein GCM10027417_30750 [Glutamicibacter endophyticus]